MKEAIVQYEEYGTMRLYGEVSGELVRCKDCKHKKKTGEIMVCKLSIPIYKLTGKILKVEENDYCSNGRREDE